MYRVCFYYILAWAIALSGGCSYRYLKSADKAYQETNNTTAVAAVYSLNSRWQFTRSAHDLPMAQISAMSWETVTLPHTPQIEPMLVNSQFQGYSWYKKHIEVKPEWRDKKIFVRFEGAMNIADIYLNGKQMAHHKGGYLPFTIDISENLDPNGNNALLVKLDNTDNAITGPKPLHKLDFNTYGGLYRSVNLLVKDPLHITDEMLAGEVAGGGVFVTYPKVAESASRIAVKTHVANESDTDTTFTVVQKLYYDGQLIVDTGKNLSLKPSSQIHVEQELDVKDAKLWSPASPNLYELRTQLWRDKSLVENKTTKIGIREFAFNEQHELLINGEKTFLRGVNRHQEYPHVGYATSPEADYRDAYKIKSAGFDYVRLSHYPHSPAFMRAADELGLVLIDAILGWQYVSDSAEFKQHVLQTCRDMIRRDRNHPSVLAWECSLNESRMGDELIQSFHNVVKQEFPNGYSAGWQLGYDIYLQARQHRLKHYSEPEYPYNVSEYGDWEYYAQNAGLNQDDWADLKSEERSSRQLLSSGEKRLLQQARNIQEAHNDNLQIPAFADGYWVMFDYNRGYADDLEASGIMSLYRLPKYSYYFFQSQRPPTQYSEAFESGPMVFIASEWQPHSSTNVKVYSNAEEVELWLNGTLIDRQKPKRDALSSHLAHPPFVFNTETFKKGTLTAKAYIQGKLVAQHQVSTPGEASQLTFTLDTSGIAVVPGDIVFVYVNLLDAQGNLVPLNGVPVEVSALGEIAVLNPEIPVTEQGRAAVLIKAGPSFEQAELKATAMGISHQVGIF